ncbi:MAG TPA: P-loop NTPase fold protein [Streptosporangiaceae bacterium]|nr:P-loop NTPase fold protein [Streptosporangiaceae bacterium]
MTVQDMPLEPSSAFLRLAMRVVVVAWKIALPSAGDRVDSIDDIAAEITTSDLTRPILAELRRTTNSLAEQFQQFISSEFTATPQSDSYIAVEAVEQSFREVTSWSDVDAIHPEASIILNKIEKQVVDKWRSSLLSEEATEYGRACLRQAATYVASIARSIPHFEESLGTDPSSARRILNFLQTGVEDVVQPRLAEVREAGADSSSPQQSLVAMPVWVDPGYSPDSNQGTDVLGVRKDATAFATLLASTALEPPLALALYGDWGSGKTFFMRLLDREIARLSENNPNGFRTRVAAVWFNAWQYAEGNLWASLTHHIFLSLHGGPAAPQTRLDAALARVEGIRVARDNMHTELIRSEATVLAAKERLAEVHRRSEAARENAQKIRARDLLEAVTVDPELRQALNDAARELGVPEAANDARELYEAAGEVRSVIESGRSLAVAGPWWRSPLALGVTVVAVVGACCVALILGLHVTRSSLTPVAEFAGQILALAGGVAAWTIRQGSLVRGLMRPAERIQRQVNQRLAEQQRLSTEQLAAAVQEVERSESDLAQAQRRLLQAEEREAEARSDLSQLTGARLLKRYLADRAASGEYGQYLGAVALASRDLQDLAAYLETSRSSDDADAIDRIVLYVDDLDRCQPNVVVQVLEAVNVLLSLPLFVVILGVDSRWLTQSLEDVHSTLLGGGRTSYHASTVDYLDKIFQLSYRLPPMGVEKCADLLEYTALSSLSRPVNYSSDLHGDPGRVFDRRALDETRESEAFAREHEQADGYEALATALEITAEELTTIRGVAVLVGSSPRRAKRFINIYRIIKARALTDASTYELLSDSAAKAYAVRALIVVTAVAVGLPTHMARLVETQSQLSAYSDLNAWLRAQDQRHEMRAPENVRLREFLLADAVPTVSISDVVLWLPTVFRFAWQPQSAGPSEESAAMAQFLDGDDATDSEKRIRREVAALKEFDVPMSEGLTRAQASAALKRHDVDPRAFGSWVSRNWVANESDRRYLTAKGRDWLSRHDPNYQGGH